ncbi:MAG: hypothetical protein RSF67_06240 [Clostridia bacterium]
MEINHFTVGFAKELKQENVNTQVFTLLEKISFKSEYFLSEKSDIIAFVSELIDECFDKYSPEKNILYIAYKNEDELIHESIYNIKELKTYTLINNVKDVIKTSESLIIENNVLGKFENKTFIVN